MGQEPKVRWTLGDVTAYLKKTWFEVTSFLSFKWFMVWVLTCLDVVLLMSHSLAQTSIQTVNKPGPWDDIARLILPTIGPLDWILLCIVFVLYVIDLVLGTTLALIEGRFQHRKIFLSFVKATGYLGILIVAWILRLSDNLGLLPMIGLVAGRVVEGFVVGTEAISCLKNLDRLLAVAGTSIPGVSAVASWLDRNMRKRAGQFGAPHYDVLLVEDDEATRALITSLLEREGSPFTVRAFERLKTAVEEAKRHSYSVALLDLNLQGSSGLDTFISFKTKVENLPVLVFTGSEDQQVLQECMRLGAMGVLPKDSLTRDQFLSAIIGAVSRHETSQFIKASLAGIDLRGYLIPRSKDSLDGEPIQIPPPIEIPGPPGTTP